MKLYFDNLKEYESNCHHLTYTDKTDYWVVAPGSNIKNVLVSMGNELTVLDTFDGHGVYIVDVRGDPEWWSGVLRDTGVPQTHIIESIPKHIKDRIRLKQIRLIIAADREGGPMNGRFDCFAAATAAMRNERLPAGSVLIMQGNKKIEQQYTDWLEEKSEERLFEVMYSNHFGKIFSDVFLPTKPVIQESISNPAAYSYNSLNRVYRSHRGSHLYKLSKDKILENGLVSANEVRPDDRYAALVAGVNIADFYDIMQKNYPKYVDGNWTVRNAANQYNIDIYKNSIMSVITETIFFEDVVFLTEKIFKPMTMGHPLILFASAGTLNGLRELGFRTDWCGIDPSYNDIKDHVERFNATHQVVLDWVNLSRAEQQLKIENNMTVIDHNFQLMQQRDFYKEALAEAVNRSERYFNERS